MEANDHDLLRQFAAHRSEDAFRQLVNRHVGMVFSVARRVTDDPQLAEEVAQTTFATLAQKAGELRPDDVPAGWLYHAARHLALRAVRSEQRRRQREHLAATMNTDEPGPSVVAEHLESAMDQLPPADRDALVLRFFEDRNLREVGHELGLTEDAARMRVNRALEKLRGVFGKLGITGSAAWLGTTLTTSATASVPAGLGTTITTAVLGGTAIAAATTALVTQTTTTTMNLFNLKTAAAILGAAAVTGTTTYLVQEREAGQLRADYQTLNEAHGKLADEQREALAMIQLRDGQIAALRRDVADVHRLRGEVDRLNRDLSTQDKLEEENRSLRLQVERLLASQPPAASGLGTPVTKDSLVFAGYATPENTLLSALWGQVNGDFDVFTGAMDEATRAEFLRNESNKKEFQNQTREFSRYFVGAQIVARKELDSDHVELLFRMNLDRSAGNPPPNIDSPELVVLPFTREDGEWKARGTTNPTPDFQAWERDGRVIRYAR